MGLIILVCASWEYVLGTRDQEQLRVDEADFHRSSSGAQADQMTIKLVFRGLTKFDRGAFAEFLTFEEIEGVKDNFLVLTWSAKRLVMVLVMFR